MRKLVVLSFQEVCIILEALKQCSTGSADGVELYCKFRKLREYYEKCMCKSC